MPTWAIIVLSITAVLLAGFIGLVIWGNKMKQKSDAAQASMLEGAQTYTVLVIDKKMMKLQEAGFPQIVVDQTPKRFRNSKVPVVKIKIGPRVVNCMCDAKIYDLIPIKKEVYAVMNGIYIIDVKGLRSALVADEKKGFKAKLREKLRNADKARNTVSVTKSAKKSK